LKTWKNCFLFSLGGGLYAILELLWRGRTHGSMFLLGGGCFLLLGKLRRLPLGRPLQAFAGGALVTTGELLTGLLVNRRFTVWDYRRLPLNFLGQICLPYSLLWMPLSLFAMWLYGRTEQKMSEFGTDVIY
jgi:uncharacterized membrane protein